MLMLAKTKIKVEEIDQEDCETGKKEANKARQQDMQHVNDVSDFTCSSEETRQAPAP